MALVLDYACIFADTGFHNPRRAASSARMTCDQEEKPMPPQNQDNVADTEKASNLRAIFKILSYIHADAVKDDFKELADRIEFALNLAEMLVRKNRSAAKTEGGEAASAASVPDKESEPATTSFY
ncbi:MAG: hypothetical protein CMN55_09595 [Sneathiella sp.]|jgi:hypothetical protein|nr:hypothetical protein [Sneathiella sp.]|tara:strand:+ start:812 stop:1186 length:375 start_codon:yes stop_codon:yes gene_type:complete